MRNKTQSGFIDLRYVCAHTQPLSPSLGNRAKQKQKTGKRVKEDGQENEKPNNGDTSSRDTRRLSRVPDWSIRTWGRCETLTGHIFIPLLPPFFLSRLSFFPRGYDRSVHAESLMIPFFVFLFWWRSVAWSYTVFTLLFFCFFLWLLALSSVVVSCFVSAFLVLVLSLPPALVHVPCSVGWGGLVSCECFSDVFFFFVFRARVS